MYLQRKMQSHSSIQVSDLKNTLMILETGRAQSYMIQMMTKVGYLTITTADLHLLGDRLMRSSTDVHTMRKITHIMNFTNSVSCLWKAFGTTYNIAW